MPLGGSGPLDLAPLIGRALGGLRGLSSFELIEAGFVLLKVAFELAPSVFVLVELRLELERFRFDEELLGLSPGLALAASAVWWRSARPSVALRAAPPSGGGGGGAAMITGGGIGGSSYGGSTWRFVVEKAARSRSAIAVTAVRVAAAPAAPAIPAPLRRPTAASRRGKR